MHTHDDAVANGAAPSSTNDTKATTIMTDAFRNADLPIEERVADLLSRLTLQEKAGQLSQYFYFGAPESSDADVHPDQQDALSDDPHMVENAIIAGGAGSALFVKEAATANRLQRLAVEQSRLGIPLIFGFDVIHGMRTIFPVPIALAASWSPQTIESAQAAAAREARALGIHWTFAPMVDIARDPRWGRIIEGAGEDPVLGAAVAAAQVRGFQGDFGAQSVLAGPKHFAGYGAARGGRDYDESDISDSELWNVYFPPFRAGVEAGAANIMGAYMDLNGVPASANRWLFTDVLRGDMGFDGFVVSDANAVRSLEVQHFAKDLADAGVRAIKAGLDMEMCMVDPAFSRLPQAVADGLITEDEVDTAVRRVLTAKFRLGLFENPYVDEAATETILGGTEQRELARAAAEKTFVLLKNEGETLPLRADALNSVAVIGQLADSKRDTLGPWIFAQDTEETVTILDGLRARLGDDATVSYAPGASIPERVFTSMFDRMDDTVPHTPAGYDDDAEIERAVQLAAASDVAIVVVGQRQNQIGEKASVSTLDLPGRQQEQLERIVATGTPVALLVMSGRPLDLRWASEKVPAILQVWYPGTRGGEAVASVLLGDTSPAGRLPFTWPRHVGQVPMVHSHYRTFQPEEQGERYWDEQATPLYPFGHGLSYADLEYSNLRLDRSSIGVGETATVTVDVRNDSDRDADDVVQLYIHQRYGTSSRPIRELKAFERITVPAGATTSVSFTLGPDQLRYWSAVTRGFLQDATTIDVWVGGSSEATLATVLEVTG
jgi:beta-glucosidase